MLLKFRGFPVALFADIEKAFHQTSISSSDRNKRQFLWCTIFRVELQNDEAAFSVYKKAKHIMSEGGFNLRKWHTNSKELRERIDDVEIMAATNEPNNINLKAAEFQSSENELSKVKSLEDTSTVLKAPEAKWSEVKILGLN